MHQPYYKDDKNKVTHMPWVFLHGIKDYYDIPWYLSKHSQIKGTFNLVPSLIEQLTEYIEGSSNDLLLNILQKDISQLNNSELSFMEDYLFLSNLEYMIKPFKRYYELYLKFKARNESFIEFTPNDIVDTQVLFLLSWCGNYLRENNPFIKELIAQQHSYSHEQKIKLLNSLLNFIKDIIPFYKKLLDKNQISISTTPFYHPILPLLINRDNAKKANGDIILPKTEAFYNEFALKQIQDAKTYYKKIFNTYPIGFWPSEGSVSYDTAQLLRDCEIKWIASDEEILFKTDKTLQKDQLYLPYCIKTADEKKINIFFRDKYLSDLIGFEYSKKDPKEAAKDFIAHLKNIYLNNGQSKLVSVILDGENAWEYYPNNAIEFFHELYSLLEKQEWCESILFDEIDTIKELDKKELNNLASGSWINGNFDIWMGSKQKNQAWELLDKAKNHYDTIKDTLNEAVKSTIDKEFLIALGSDWFWWYGDDHYTSLNTQFDNKFRTHIKNIYELMDISVPVEVFAPIAYKENIDLYHIKPNELISPLVEGKISTFFEWYGGGHIDLKKELGTMNTSSIYIEEIFYGKDANDTLYLYIKGSKLLQLSENKTIKIKLDNEMFSFNLKKEITTFTQKGKDLKVAVDRDVELSITSIKNNTIEFILELFEDKNKIQQFPIYNNLVLDFTNLDLKKWYI